MLDCQADRDYDIKVTIMSGARQLDLHVATSSKSAGKKALFYVKSMIINNTEEEMLFYYEEPSEKEVKSGDAYREGVAGSSKSKFLMLSDVSCLLRSYTFFVETRSICGTCWFYQGLQPDQYI